MDPNSFFGHEIDPLTLAGKAVALLLAVALGALIGLDRQLRGQPAGLRTHVLVCVGSTLITLTSVEFAVHGTTGADSAGSRIAAQIVSGIGFLGAGAIVRDGTNVHGLTTAASIWVVAALGMAVGASPRLGETAVVATAIVLLSLLVLTRLEEVFHLKQEVHELRAEVREEDHAPARLLALLTEHAIPIQGVDSKPGPTSDSVATRKMTIRLILPRTFDRTRLINAIAQDPQIVQFDLD